jgi:membrane dipeptidase
MLIVDGHCDTLLALYKNAHSFWEENKKGHLDWPRLQKGLLKMQFMSIYIEPQYKPYGALCRTLELIDYYQQLLMEGEGKLSTVLWKEDLQCLKKDPLLRIVLSIEGGEALEGRLSTLRIFYQLGIRSLTLTWNQRNQLADGMGETVTKGGLTTFGREVVREMNRLGMLIDIAHLSEAGFWDVLSLSEQPVAVTHACCAALHEHARNLTNEQLQALAENEGIIGINYCPHFLGKQKKITLDHVIAHLEYAVSVAGINHVGLGSDFDGIDKTPQGLEDVAKVPALIEKMLQRGWHEEEVKKIMGGNFIRVLETVLPEQTNKKK